MDREDRSDLASVASTNATGFRRVAIGNEQALQEGIRAGNINISNDQTSSTITVGFSSDNQDNIRRHQELQRKYDVERQARNVSIPTTDSELKSRLRELREPITLFNENVLERGERLKKAIVAFMDREGRLPSFTKPNQSSAQVAEDEEFYTPGSAELKKARIVIAKYSIPLSTYRLEKMRRQRLLVDRLDEELQYDKYIGNFGDYDIVASQYADERCVSKGDLSPNEELYATSGWSGECKVWGIPDCEIRTELKGHRDRVNHIRFHPMATIDLSPNGPNIATASADSKIRLWSLSQDSEFQESMIFKGHEDRANFVEFHPTGKYFASSSHDKTWRFWDIETKTELSCQEGHVAPVYPLSFQNDGALLASGDLNGVADIWDLRNGKCILNFVAHRRQCIAIKFLPNWYQVATGGDDNQIKIWDLRKKSWVQIVPAHFKLISSISFEQDEGKYMVSTSYDGKWKVWNTHEWIPVTTLAGQETKLSSASVTRDTKYIVTTSFDRTMKLWKRKDPNEIQEQSEHNSEAQQNTDVQMATD